MYSHGPVSATNLINLLSFKYHRGYIVWCTDVHIYVHHSHQCTTYSKKAYTSRSVCFIRVFFRDIGLVHMHVYYHKSSVENIRAKNFRQNYNYRRKFSTSIIAYPNTFILK